MRHLVWMLVGVLTWLQVESLQVAYVSTVQQLVEAARVASYIEITSHLEISGVLLLRIESNIAIRVRVFWIYGAVNA